MSTPSHTEAVTVYFIDMFKDILDLSNAVDDGVLSKTQAKPLRDWLIDNPNATYNDAIRKFGYVRDNKIPLTETLSKVIDTGNYDLKNIECVKPIVDEVMKQCKPAPNPKFAEALIKDILLFD